MGITSAVSQDVVRVQHALGSASGDRNTATFSSTPEEGNLLVAFSIFRLGANAATSPVSPGTGWELRAVNTFVNSGSEWDRRGIAIWTKIAGSSEPTTITTTWNPTRNNDLVIMEYRNNDGAFGSFLGSSVANNGTSYQNTIDSGNITNSTSGDYFVLSGMFTRGQVASVGWTGGLGNTIIANGPQDHSYATAFNVQTTSGNISTQATPSAWVQMNLALIAFELAAPSKIRVETAANGSGSVVSAQDLASGNALTVYAVSRDDSDNFTGLVTDATWSLQNITGGVASGNLIDNLNGSATFTGVLTGSATIRASSGTLNETQSGTISVIPGAASSLAFHQQPSNIEQNISISPAPTVRVLDAAGNLRTNDNSTQVSIAISNNPAGGSLSGTSPVTASGGVATFSNLSINEPGEGYTLQATSSGLTPDTSDAFDIMGPDQELYNTPGTTTFTVPPGVKEVSVQVWGAGGAGGGGLQQGQNRRSGGGGGGGAYRIQTYQVTPGQQITVNIGQGGQTNGATGGNSQISFGATTLTANGGGGGGNATGGGGGGSGAGGTGATGGTYNGANGAGGVAANGGGGGGSAGTDSNGNAGSGINGGVAVTGGGGGGNGTSIDGGSGVAGGVPGGGGGGGRGNGGTGGVGGNGQVVFTWSAPSASNSTMNASPASGVPTNGVDGSTITITARNSANQIMGEGLDLFFEILSGTGTLSSGPWTTNSNGQATATLTSTTEGTVQVRGYLGTNNSGEIVGTTSVGFSASTYTITGTILDTNNNPIQNVSVTASGGHTQTVNTNASGQYTLTGVEEGAQNIVITPSIVSHSFTPATRTVNGPVNNDISSQNFTGELITYTLSVFKSGNGSVNVDGSPYSTPVTVTAGTSVNLQAIPDSGWDFTNWTGDFSSNNASDTILMDSDKTITANFNPEQTPGVSLKLQYKNNQTNQFGDIRPHMILFNDGDITLNFTDITIRYWFESDPPGLDVYNTDWAQIGTASVIGNFGSVGSERYLEVGFTAAAEIPGWKGGTGPNNFPNGTDSGEIQSRINDDGFGNYDQSLHYSWDPAFTAFADYQKITVYHKGNLIWGTPPAGGAEAENMIITQQPSTVTAGANISPAPTVKLEDAMGNPVEGVAVTVTLNKNNFSGGSTAIVTSNASGLAVFDNLSINTADTGYQLTFDADAPLVINRSSSGFTVNAALAADMTITQQPPGTVTAGSAIAPAPAVTVVDAFGNPRSGVNVTVSLNKNSFAGSTTTVATNASGVATFSNLIINTAATNYIITFNADAVGVNDLNSSVFNVNAASASNMAITTQPGESVAGGVIAGPPTVQVTDAFSNPVSGVNVTVSETGNNYTFDAGILTKATNSSGVATFNDIQINAPATGYQLTFDADAIAVSNVISSLFNVVTSGGSMSVTQQPTQTVAGVVISPSPSITLVDGSSNPIQGVNVTVSLNENSFASGTLTVPTNASGVAVFNDLVIQAAGSDYQITFNADQTGVANVFSNNFNVLASDPASMSVTIQPNNTVAGNVVQGPPSVTIVDAFNNPVSGINITVSLNQNSFNSGTATVASNANGLAEYSDLVITTAATAYQIIFNADAVGVNNINSNNFNITAAAANSMSITTQPGTSTAGVALSPNPVVRVQDIHGNPKSGVDVTATLNKNSFGAGSTTIVTSNSSGEAVFNNLKINSTDTGYEVTFSATSLTSVTTTPFEVIQPDPDFGTVRLEYRVIETAATSNVIRFGFRITNESGVDLSLDELEIRYWYTSEPAGTNIYSPENAPIGTQYISGATGTIENEFYMGLFISADAVVSVGQGSDGVTANYLPDNANTGIIEGRINEQNWGNFTQTNDYSFDSSVTAYANYQNINVYYKGKLVWGTQPAAVEGGVDVEFVQQPTNTVQNEVISPAVTVRILDRNGALVSGDNSTEVNLAIQNDPTTNATLSGTTTKTAVNGIATFDNLAINNIGVGYTFVATATGMTNDVSNSFNILSASTYSISGTILDSESNPVSGVQVTASGGYTSNTTTNASGVYSITGIEWGTENVVITPSLTGYTFNPVNITIPGPITADIINQNFTGTAGTFSISGTITDGSNPIPDAEVTATGGHSQTVTTNASGVYTMTDVSLSANVTITPTVGSFTYTPTSITVNNINTDVTGQDFVGAPTGSRTISGTILDLSSNPVAGVTVVASGDHTQTVTTNGSGFYQFSGLPTGNKTVIVTPTPDGYTFNPTSITVNNNFSGTPNVTGQNFVATVVAGTYYSRATGNWNDAANWSTVSHAGAAAGRSPKSTDEIIIGSDDTITLNLTTFTLDNPGTISVNNTGVLVFTGENHIAGTGTFTLASGGGLIIGSANGITSSGSTGSVRTTTRTFNTGANFTYNGSSAQVTGNGLPQEVNDLRINNSNNVRSSGSVQVDGTLYLEDGTYIMSDGLSLIANTKDIDSGQLQYELEIGGQQGYRLLASPLNVNYGNLLSEVTTQGFTGASLTDTDPLQPNVLWYDETYEGTDNQRWRAPADIGDNVVPGRGYHVYMFGDIASDSRYNDPFPYTLIVDGQENEGTTGEVDLNVTYTENGDTGWNLVGNPFGASIDWDDASNWTKTNIDASIYIWDPNSNQYKTWNGSAGDVTDGIIAPFQGFWVKANATSPELVVSREAKTLDAGAGFVGKLSASKGREDASISIMAYHSDHLHSTAHFSFTDDGRLGMDSRDAHRLLPPPDVKNYLEFYSRVEDNERLAVNNLPGRFGRPIEIPLELNAYHDGNAVSDEVWLKIDSFKNIPSDWVMELMNEITGEKILVMEGDSIRISMAHMEGRNVELTNSTGKVTTKSPMAHVSFTLMIHPEMDAYGLNHEFTLHQNYPNPFNPTTTLEFDLPIPGVVQLEVYDMIGRRVAVLVNHNLQAGNYKYSWDASGMSSGIYIARLVTADGMFTRKLTVIK